MDCTCFFISFSQVKGSIVIALLLGAAHGMLPRELLHAKLCHVSIHRARPHNHVDRSCLSITYSILQGS
jgi:hypothetical protein